MLQDKAREIIEAFNQTKRELSVRLEQIREEMERYTEEYKIANTHGDRRENAAFEDAVAGMKRCNIEFADVQSRLDVANKVKDFSQYQPLGMVLLYSTVQLRRLDDDRCFVYMIFPEGVSDLDRGIISIDSRVARAIKGKAVGDIVQVQHSVNGNEYSYVVEDIY